MFKAVECLDMVHWHATTQDLFHYVCFAFAVFLPRFVCYAFVHKKSRGVVRFQKRTFYNLCLSGWWIISASSVSSLFLMMYSSVAQVCLKVFFRLLHSPDIRLHDGLVPAVATWRPDPGGAVLPVRIRDRVSRQHKSKHGSGESTASSFEVMWAVFC